MKEADVRSKVNRRPRKVRLLGPHLFALPYVIVLVIFGLVPAVYALLMSFARFVGGKPQFFQAGLRNYVIALNDTRFLDSFEHVGRYLLVSMPIGVVGVLLMALLLHARPGRLALFFRTVFFVPSAFAGPALVLLSFFILNPVTSPFRSLMLAMGLQSSTDVYIDDNYPLLFTLMGFFAGAGGWVAIFYGALSAISKEILEAAAMDGCSGAQIAWHIKLPMILPYVAYMLILLFAGNVQLFAEPQLANAADWSPNQLAYSYAFMIGNFGVSAAISLTMMLIGLIAAVVIIRYTGFYRTDATAS
jgi:multiple sugar transport system permease protein